MSLKVLKTVGAQFSFFKWHLLGFNIVICSWYSIIPLKLFQQKIMAIINGLRHFNGILMANQCIFNGMCMQQCSTLSPSYCEHFLLGMY